MVFQRHNETITFENVLALVFEFMMPLKQDLPLPWTKSLLGNTLSGFFLRLHPHRPIYVCCTKARNFLRRLCPTGQNALVCKPFDGGRHQSVWFDPPNHRLIKVFNPRDQARTMIQFVSIHTGKTLVSFDLFKTCHQIQIKAQLNHVNHNNTCGHGNQIAIIVWCQIFVFEVDHHPGQPIRVFLKTIKNVTWALDGRHFDGRLCFNADGTKLMFSCSKKVIVWETVSWDVCYEHEGFGYEKIMFAAFHPATCDVFVLMRTHVKTLSFGPVRVATVGDPLLEDEGEWVLRRNGKPVLQRKCSKIIPNNMSVSNSAIALSFYDEKEKNNYIQLWDIRKSTCKLVREYSCESGDKSWISMHVDKHEETMLCLDRPEKFAKDNTNRIVLRKLCVPNVTPNNKKRKR